LVLSAANAKAVKTGLAQNISPPLQQRYSLGQTCNTLSLSRKACLVRTNWQYEGM